MVLESIDWGIILAFFVVALLVGVWVARRAGRSSSEFFLSGRHMPWWLLGMSMVATTFSTDTPNLVTDIVRQNGVAGNWVWWAFLLTGMLTVFVYAKLWRRTGVMTDVEFYEVRYSGKPAAFLRGFRALYLGVFFNVMIMAAVSLAAIKIGEVMLGFSPMKTILVAALVTVAFSTLGGFRGVLLTDFLLFFVAMVGAVAAAVVALDLPEVGGLSGMLSHPSLADKLSIFPSFDVSKEESTQLLITVFIIPLAVQWWSVWYPGSEPGGGGYIAQRMLAAKDENHAVGATFFFNAAHYALRPWPWIIVALCSLIVFPLDSKPDRDAAKAALNAPDMKPLVQQWEADPESVGGAVAAKIQALRTQQQGLTAIQKAFPKAERVGHDMGYPAMLTFLPRGLLGLVLASLIAAYMSTISTHLNWGSSYVVNDFYKRFVKSDAGEKELVWVGRISTVVLMVLTAVLALWLKSSYQAFGILLQIGAGTGLLFLLRWFWWRVSAFSELAGMIVSFLVAVYFEFVHTTALGAEQPAMAWKLVIGVGITTATWIVATFLTRPTASGRLREFYRLALPGGPGWRGVVADARAAGDAIDAGEGKWTVPLGILCMFAGCVAVYSALFATGFFLYGNVVPGIILAVAGVVAAAFLFRTWRKVSTG
jgi:Na+/proline symporter